MSFENTPLSIKKIDDLIRILSLASLLEVSGWPKPGNVHRTYNYKDTRFEHFLAGTLAIQPSLKDLCERSFKYSLNVGEDYSFVRLGYFFREAAKEMMEWQRGGNVLLGHILILGPLAAAASICLKSKKTLFKHFAYNVIKTINDGTIKDTINMYEAIRISNPGGLGKVDKYDVNDKSFLKQIKSDKMTLKKIFVHSKEQDLISNEYASGFNIILNEGLPYFLSIFNRTKDINIATVNTFLKTLAEHPDTLIIRKSGKDSALYLSNRAMEIVEKGGISTREGFQLTLELDKELRERIEKMNPGTTADIIAGVIFCALLFGVRF